MTSVYFAIILRKLYASSKPTLHDLHQKGTQTLNQPSAKSTQTLQVNF